jgi:hypothetical protein
MKQQQIRRIEKEEEKQRNQKKTKEKRKGVRVVSCKNRVFRHEESADRHD